MTQPSKTGKSRRERRRKLRLSRKQPDYKSWSFSRNRRSERFISLFPKALKALGTDLEIHQLEMLVNCYIATYERLCKHEGKIMALRLLKSCYGIAQRYAVSHCYDSLPFRKSDDDGFPLMVNYVKPFLKGELKDRRCVLCILQLFKLQETECQDYDINTVIQTGFSTDYSSESNLPGRYFLYIGKCKPHLGKFPRTVARAWKETLNEMFPLSEQADRIKQMEKLNKVHISYKSGPNGPALGNAWKDFISIRKSETLLNSIMKIADLTNNELLEKTTVEFSKAFEQRTLEDYPYCHSRLRLKQEPGAKVRVFAIGDFFTQWALGGIHAWCFGWLLKQPEDGTFNQDRTANIVKEWGQLGIPNVSEDLTAATDSLPTRGPLREIAIQIVGKPLADEWINLLINRDFKDPKENSVRYGIGQPMGFKTSWALLAIWHHAVFRTVLKLKRIPRDPNDIRYVVVGDDSDCKSDLASLYNYIVKELCEIKISPTKGFSSETFSSDLNPFVDEPHLVVSEFAKRVFVNGVEITPISPVLIRDGIEHPSAFPDLLSEAFRRDYFSNTSHPDVYSLSQLGFKPRRAIQLASFPLWPAPFPGYWTEEKIAEARCEEDVVWNKIPLQTLTHFTKLALAKLVESSINESMVQLTDFIGGLNQRIELNELVENKFSNKPQLDLLVEVFYTLRSNLMFGMVESPGLAGDRGQFTNIISKDLKNSIQELRVLSDWQDLIAEARDYKKTNDRFEARFLSQVYNRIKCDLISTLATF